MGFCGACALLALLFVSSVDSSEPFQTTVKPNKGSEVTVSSQLPDCTVCTVSGVNDAQSFCQPSLKLEPEKEVKLLFKCPQPIEQSYNVTISSLIECTKDACSPATVEVQSSLLSKFSRTFTWKLKAPEKTLVSLKVLRTGLTKAPHPCSDGRQYSAVTSETSKEVLTRYCEGGSETQLDLSDQGVVTLEAKPNTQVESVLFQALAAPMKRVMTVTIGPASTVVLTRDPGKEECDVCVTSGGSPDCHATEKTLKGAEKLPLEFRCLKPEDVFTVKMITNIGCTQTSCSPASAEMDPDLFKGFRRTLTWDVAVPDRTVLTLEFPGLKEKSASENCEGGIQYTVSTMRIDGQMRTSSYCKDGTASQLELFGKTTVTVDVPKEGELDRTVFSSTAVPSRGRSMYVTSDPNTNLIITKVDKEADCQICVTEASKQTCKPQMYRLKNLRNASVDFTCPQPQKVFTVEINKDIGMTEMARDGNTLRGKANVLRDCTQTSCSGKPVQADNGFFPNYNRTFTWDIKVGTTQTFHLDFPGPGLQQIPNGGTCPDGHTYSVILYLHRAAPATIGTFCKGGPVTSVLGQYKGRVMLTVPSDVNLDPPDFQLKVGPYSEVTAIVRVKLPRGVSDTEFITPNYPKDFPDDEQILWDFSVPEMHNYSVQFSEHSAPECLEEGAAVEVEYQKEGKNPTRTSLTGPQPQHQQGGFNLTVKNCKTNLTLPGLSLRYSVSVMRSGHPVLCTLDLTKQEVSVQIEKVGSDPLCEIRKDSKEEKTIKVAKGETAKLSFLDCPNEDLRLTATELIACPNASLCAPTLLFVPTLDPCLPMPLHSFSWFFTIPHEATLDLVSPTGSLRQSLPGQECDPSSVVGVGEKDGSFIGNFCSNGEIQKLQIHSNISITATPQDVKRSKEPLLDVSVSPEIKETIIYRISPNLTSPTILVTPNWPTGMKPHSSVSWIVDLPWMHHAHIKFAISGLECENSHTRINVKHQEGGSDLLDINESEKMRTENTTARQSFYLNVTNCQPEGRDQFNVKATIVLERKTNLLPILLGLVGAVLLLLLILVVVCVVLRKKKSKMNSQSSIYMGKGNIFRPNDGHFVKTRADNDSHVYDYIDDSMVYGHLLTDNESIPNGMQVDSYQTFTGPTDNTLPVIKEPDPEPKGQYQSFLSPSDTFLPPRPRTPIGRQDSLGFQDRRMMDNELYTFKSTGDMNTIRLSGADMEPQLPIMDESL
ncbi:CUB domain-containing protein 1 isoform X1 [Poecilia latipinna]|uniref:CUB domain-containing protein 1 isoform X1 n=1 Tax=Poecilia latipinna TaxID=48699 RepID=UPI00072DE05F|nr:PREDICTED: CUB domain-containing protein 1-like isoform X1 [Poecilia latipinna]